MPNSIQLSVLKKVAMQANVPLFYGTFEARPAVIALGRVQAAVAFAASVDDAEVAARSVMPNASLSAIQSNVRIVENIVGIASACEEVLGTSLRETFGEADWRKNFRLRAVRWRGLLLNAGLAARVMRPLRSEPVTVCHGQTSERSGLLVVRTPEWVGVTMGLTDDQGDVAPEVAPTPSDDLAERYGEKMAGKMRARRRR